MNTTERATEIWPGPEDQMVRWNIRSCRGQNGIDLWERLHSEKVEADPFEYAGTQEWIDEFLSEDVEQVKTAALQSVQSHLPSASVDPIYGLEPPTLDEDCFAYRGELMSLSSPIDRTIEMPVINPCMFTVDLCHHLQQTFFLDWPQWRLHVVGTANDGEESLLIYPSAVWVGRSQCPPNNLETHLNRWNQSICDIREKRIGARNRQRQYVAERIPHVINQINKNNPIVFIGAFDNWEGDFSLYNLWFLQYFELALPDSNVPDEDEIGWISSYYLDVAGKRMPYSPDLTPYEVVQCTIPKVLKPEICLSEIDDNSRNWHFQISSNEIITDQLLKQRSK